MASSVSTDLMACRQKIEMYHHAPADAATEQSVKSGASTTTWSDMRDYARFGVGAMSTVLTGNGLIELSIYAAEDDSGTNATEIKTSGTIAADAAGDWAFEECTAEEIAHIGEENSYDLRYVAAYVDCHHNDDEVSVVYIRDGAKRAADALTAATTISS